jgi:hypothetical protein
MPTTPAKLPETWLMYFSVTSWRIDSAFASQNYTRMPRSTCTVPAFDGDTLSDLGGNLTTPISECSLLGSPTADLLDRAAVS